MDQSGEQIAWKRCEYGCARQDLDGNWWSLNHQSKGWSSFGYRYPSLQALQDEEHSRVAIDDPQSDKWGTFYWIDKNMSSSYWSG